MSATPIIVALRAFVAALVAAAMVGLLAWNLAAASPVAPAAGAIPTYDSHYTPALPADATTERGPPAAYDMRSSCDAVDSRSQAVEPCQDAAAAPVFTTYNTVASPVQVVSATDTTAPQRRADSKLSSPASAGVAAKTGASALDSLSPAVRANVDDAIERAAAGKVRFTGHDGKVYDNWDVSVVT